MEQRPNNTRPDLAEYIFLLPQVLAVSPLFVVFKHIREFGDGADFVFSFRLITLAYILMVTTIILYLWRPSIRKRHSFRRNLTRASVLGIVATVPIPLAMQILSKYENLSVQLFTSLETTTASLALLLCVATNLSCLVTLFRSLPSAKVHRFDFLSIAVNLILLGLAVKWW